MVSEQILQEATRRLIERFRPEQIILFGSQARGTADHRSDVDLLVVCPFTGKRRDLMVAMDRALGGLGIARDIIVLTRRSSSVIATSPHGGPPRLAEGRRLYGPT